MRMLGFDFVIDSIFSIHRLV
uniref:Uncharacterized protein n=1 Tax=Rhizophora mucronata TaxID=61149 RepID=A0A2P2J0X9_RHIMU